jgi:hypothetical protein
LNQAETPILGKSLGNINCDKGSVQSVEHCKAAMEIRQEAIAIAEETRVPPFHVIPSSRCNQG